MSAKILLESEGIGGNISIEGDVKSIDMLMISAIKQIANMRELRPQMLLAAYIETVGLLEQLESMSSEDAIKKMVEKIGECHEE